MANTFLSLPTTAANGPGTAVDVSAMGATKTIVVEGNGSGLFEPYVQIEISNDSAGAEWTPIYQFKSPGSITIDSACHRMRATVQNYNRGGAPTVNVGGQATGTTLLNLPATPTNGQGTPVVVSGLGPFKTVQVTGTFKGACIIQVSNDGGTSWAQADGYAFRNKGGLVNGVLIGQQFRVVRSGIQAREPYPGLPIINIGAADVNAASGTITGNGTANAVAKFTSATAIGDSSITDTGALVTSSVPTAIPALNYTNPVTPAALAAGATQNYNPAGLATAGVLRLTPDAANSSIGGIVAQTNRVLVIENLGAGNLTLTTEAAGSTAANRITCPDGVDFVMKAGAAAMLLYDTASSRWRFIAEAQGGFPYLKQLYVEGNVQLDAVTRMYQVRIDGYMNLNGFISPAALPAGTTNNYDLNPSISTAMRIRQATDVANSALSGLNPTGYAGMFLLVNLGPGTLTLLNEDAGSAATARFACGSAPKVIQATGAVWIVYDNTRWRVVG